MSNGVLTFDADERIVTCNQPGLRILGVSQGEILTQLAADFFHGKNAWVVESIRRVKQDRTLAIRYVSNLLAVRVLFSVVAIVLIVGLAQVYVAPSLRHAVYVYDNPPAEPGIEGAGSVHHVAWAAHDDEHGSWRTALQMARARPTPIIDRTYFRSIYFREPSGVLFEIATLSPGFAVDEPAESLGERLVLPERYERRRELIERTLTPVTNPRSRAAA